MSDFAETLQILVTEHTVMLFLKFAFVPLILLGLMTKPLRKNL